MQSHTDGNVPASQQATPELADIEAYVVRLVSEHQILTRRLTALQQECNRAEQRRRDEAALRYQAQCAQAALEIHLARVCAELAVLKGESQAVPA